jgi:hypothetical protein
VTLVRMRTGLVIAVRYSASRPQFNNKLVNGFGCCTLRFCTMQSQHFRAATTCSLKELPRFFQVLDYLTHQRLLFPALATTYAMHLSMNRLKVCWRV